MSKRLTPILIGLAIVLLNLNDAHAAEQPISLAELAFGEGTLESSDGARGTINAVAVFLRENSHAEIWLLMPTENIYVGGRWQKEPGSRHSVVFEITNDTNGGSAEGSGILFLRNHGVPISRLTMVIFNPGGTMLRANFKERRSQKFSNHKGEFPVAGRAIWNSESPNACFGDRLPLNCEQAYCQFVGCLPVKTDSIRCGLTGHRLIKSSGCRPLGRRDFDTQPPREFLRP